MLEENRGEVFQILVEQIRNLKCLQSSSTIHQKILVEICIDYVVVRKRTTQRK